MEERTAAVQKQQQWLLCFSGGVVTAAVAVRPERSYIHTGHKISFDHLFLHANSSQNKSQDQCNRHKLSENCYEQSHDRSEAHLFTVIEKKTPNEQLFIAWLLLNFASAYLEAALLRLLRVLTHPADPKCYLTQSWNICTGPTSPNTDTLTPGLWQGSHQRTRSPAN